MPQTPLLVQSERLLLCVLINLTCVALPTSCLCAQANVNESLAEANPVYVDIANDSGTEDGSAAYPFNTITEGLARLNNNRSTSYKLHIADGVYREGNLFLGDRSGVAVIEGESRGGVIISGSDVWTGWTQNGDNWYKSWTYNWDLGNITYNADPETNLGRRMEMVFQDGVLLRQVLNLAEMADGSYYVDENADRLYVRPLYGVDLSSPSVTMEVSVRTHLFFMYANDDVVFRNLTFQHAASGADDEVITKTFIIGGENDSGGSISATEYVEQPINEDANRDYIENVLIDNCIFQWNNGGGASVNNIKYLTIKDTAFRYNGNSGLSGTRMRHSEYVDSQFNYNNWRKGIHGGLYGWAPAGTKTLFVDDFLVRGCDFIGNQAAGLWMDFGSTNVTVFDNLMTHNWSQGFYNEANYGPMNSSALLVRNNGYWPNNDGEKGGGLLFAESREFSVSNSYIIDNAYYGLGYRNSGRISTAYWSGTSHSDPDTDYWAGVSENMSFYGNTVVAGRSENHSDWTDEEQKNANAIGLSTDGTTYWGTKSVPSYSGDYNTFYSTHTTAVFTDKEDDNFGWDDITLEDWKLDTNQDLNSTWDENWQIGLDFDAYQESEGLVVFEAENYHKNEKGVDSEPWQMNHGLWSGVLGDSGSGYMEAATNVNNLDGTAARLTYRIYINNAGTYYLALRRHAATTSDDSIHVYLNDGLVGDSSTLFSGAVSRWTWKHGNVNLGFLSAGIHTLEIVRREDGFGLDRIALADSVAKLPADGSTTVGPDESPSGRPAQTDTPITVTAEKTLVNESVGEAVYRFSRPGIDGDLTVNYSVSGNAIPGVDYVVPSGSVVIPDGSSFVEVVVTIPDDGVEEEAKDLTLTVIAGTGYTIGVPDSATVTQPANGLLAFTETNISQPAGTMQSFTLEIHNPFSETITYTLENPDERFNEYIWLPENYSWTNIASAGNAIAALDDDDSDTTDSSMRVDFGNGLFRYYGVYHFNRCVVSSNGLISFVHLGGSFSREFSGANLPLPTHDISDSTIAGYWDDLRTVTSINPASRIYANTVGERDVIQFEQLLNQSDQSVTFQIVLDYNTADSSDDEIVLYFKDVPDGDASHTAGVQGYVRRVDGNALGHTGDLIAYNEPRIVDGSAFRLVAMPEWFGTNHSGLSLSIPAGETATMEFTVDTTDLNDGTQVSRVFQLTPDRADVENAPLTVNLTVEDGPGSLSFDSADVTVQEDDGTATLTVARSAGSSGAISIDYATLDGTAAAGTNYTATSGTLNWADGETGSKSIVVPLINVPAIEATKTFTVTLGNGVGVLPPAPTVAIVSIEDAAVNVAPSITVNSPGGTPTVEDLATALLLDVTVTDDAIPAANTYLWEQVSGPGTATFDDETAADTSVTFSATGLYTIRLTASDTALNDTTDLVVQVGIPDLVAPTTGQVFYYPLDSSSGTFVSDGSGNGNNASVQNSATGDTWASGHQNNGYSFGGGSYTAIVSSEKFEITESDGMTFAAWVRLNQSDSERYLAVHRGAHTGTIREWLSVTADNRLKSSIGGSTTQTAANKIVDNQWHHVAVTAGDGSVKLYIDGVLEASRSDTIETGSTSIAIGNGTSFGLSHVWRGMIDEVYFYQATLSAHEIGILHGSAVYEENIAPEPDAGSSQQVVAGGSITLAGSASDDGKPSGGGGPSTPYYINFSELTYSSDGSNVWQTFDLNTGSGASSGSGPVTLSNEAIADSSGSTSAGLTLSISTSGVGSSDVAYLDAAKLSSVDHSGNPYAWFAPTEDAQLETFSIASGSGVWTYTLSGFDTSDSVTLEMVVARSKTGDRAVTISQQSSGDILSDAQVDTDGNPQYYPSIDNLTGATSYSFTVEPTGTSWGAVPNALAVLVSSQNPAVISYEWQQVSGPADASFDDASDPNTHVTLPVKGDYRFRLVADDGHTSSAAYVTHTATGEPTNLSASEVNGTSAHLTWTDSVGETGYRVWMRISGATEWTLVQAGLAADSASYTVENLTRNKTYEFSVEAMDGDVPREGSEISLSFGDGFTQGTSTPHLVVIEAEDYTYTGANGSDDTWTLTTAFSGYSGEGAMQAGPDGGDSYTFDIPNNAPYLAYEVDFETTGTHYIFVLCREPTGNNAGDSLHVGMNNTLPSTGELVEQTIDDNGIDASFVWAAKVRVGTRVSVEVPSTGTQTIYIWPREDGLIVDKLLLTTDSSYVPTGSEALSLGKPLGAYTAKEFWRMNSWGISSDSGNAADAANPDGDSLSNALEFAHGGNPLEFDGADILPTGRLATESGDTYLEVSFRRRFGSASGSTESGFTVDGVTYTVEVSHDLSLGSWQTGSGVIDQVGAPTYNGDGTETVTVRVLEDADSAPKKFIRVQVD